MRVDIVEHGLKLSARESDFIRGRILADAEKISATIPTTSVPILEYHRYSSKNLKLELTGEDANGHVERAAGRIHAVYSDSLKCFGPHELVHLLTRDMGYSNLVLGEGLAEYFEDAWMGRPHQEWVVDAVRSGTYIPISFLFDDYLFWELDQEGVLSYPESRCFVQHLIETFGMARFLEAYRSIQRRMPVSESMDMFQNIFGVGLLDAEKDWLAKL